MRHLYGTALAVVLTAVMFFAGAWGYLRAAQAHRCCRVSRARCRPAAGRCCRTAPPLLALVAVVGHRASWPACSSSSAGSRRSPSGCPACCSSPGPALYLVSVRRAVDLHPAALARRSARAGRRCSSTGCSSAAGVVMVLPDVRPVPLARAARTRRSPSSTSSARWTSTWPPSRRTTAAAAAAAQRARARRHGAAAATPAGIPRAGTGDAFAPGRRDSARGHHPRHRRRRGCCGTPGRSARAGPSRGHRPSAGRTRCRRAAGKASRR